MIVFPLGLGTKLRRLPVVTILIGLSWIAISLIDHSDDYIFARTLKAVASSGVKPRARALFKDYCVSRKGLESDCEKYSVLILTGFPGTLAALAEEAEEEAKHGSLAGRKSRSLALKEKKKLAHLKAVSAVDGEFAKADIVRRELESCDNSRRCYVYKDILWHFLGNYRSDPSPYAPLKSYGIYRRSLASYQLQLTNLCRDYACLIKGNITPSSLLAAQFRHGGFGHLFGNLLMLVIFGVYVEQRVGAWRYLVALLTGGTLGMAAHMVFFAPGDSMALGGSANVSAAMGMFFVFFFNHRMRFRVWLPRKIYLGRSFMAPVKYCFPLFFVLSDISGSIDSGFSTLSEGSVAHVAHLVGMLVGMAAAWWMLRRDGLPWFVVHTQEKADFAALQSLTNVSAVLTQATAMIDRNPEHVAAMEHGASIFLRWSQAANEATKPHLIHQGQIFLRTHMATICAVNVRVGALTHACRILNQVPLAMPYELYLGRLGQVNTLVLADYAVVHQHPLLSLRLYDYFLRMFPHSQKAPGVKRTALELLGHLVTHKDNLKALTGFLQHHPTSALAPAVLNWLHVAEAA